MPKELLYFLSTIGAFVIGAVVILILHEIWCWLKDHVYFLSEQNKRKNRLKSPPLAKCHCLECEYWQCFEHDETTGYCFSHRWNTADYWFCWDARKKSKERYLKERDQDWEPNYDSGEIKGVNDDHLGSS